jgi:prepilin-type N-terminal cleavage/methylation domain-containing protein
MMRLASVRNRRGFTLLELLLVFALIATMASVFVISLETMARTTPGDAIEGAFWSAMRQAREQAVQTRAPQTISYNVKDSKFAVDGPEGTKTVSLELDAPVDPAKLEAVFTQALPSNSFTLVRGRLVTEREIPSMLVFPDGTCQPVTVEFRFPGGTHRISLDPWTCAQMVDSDSEDKR